MQPATNVIQLSDYIPRKPADREPVEIIVNDCVVSCTPGRRGSSMRRVASDPIDGRGKCRYRCPECGNTKIHWANQHFIGVMCDLWGGCGAEMRPVEG